MAKATYHGPADAIELDGLRFERGKAYPMTNEQVARIRASDPLAAIEVATDPSFIETDLELVRIRDAQARMREDAQAAADKEAAKAQDEADKLEREARDRAQSAAERRDSVAREREEARREAAVGTKPKRAGKES